MKKFILICVSCVSLMYAGTMSVSTGSSTKTYNLEDIQSITFNIPAGPEMVLVQCGTFTMGNRLDGGYADEKPTHSVTLNSFYIGKYEVTQGEYENLTNTNPSANSGFGVGSNYPVYNVTWYNVVAYCNALSSVVGLEPCYTINNNSVTCDFSKNGYRLPTESKWEYAARGAAHNSDNLRYAGCNLENDLIDYAWYSVNSSGTSQEVATKQPNQINVFDMSGNVYEWCWDWYGNYSSESQTNPTGPTTGSSRLVRGGSWNNNANFARVSFRFSNTPDSGLNRIGFRLVRKAE